MVASRSTSRQRKARTFLTYSVPGGASRAAESISLRALRVAPPRTLAVDPASDRLLVSSSPPYDFQADLPGENPHVNKRGAVLEIDEVREASKYRHAVRVRCPGLTRPGGLAVAPPKHPKAGQVFVTEYGSEGRSGRVLALSGGGSSVYLDFTDLPCHAGTPQDLVNPWTLAFGPAGDALYVATDPNHRTVHRFDAAGALVRAERCADEAPNYLLCV